LKNKYASCMYRILCLGDVVFVVL